MEDCSVSELRDVLHELSHRLTVFSQENRKPEDWNKFYASTDTLLDIETAFSQFDDLDRVPTLLERYGFLQALVVAQQAVEELSKSVGLHWSAHDDVRSKTVRDYRDRIVGHPVWSTKPQKYEHEVSSAMMDLSSGTKEGFDAVLYYMDRSETVTISFSELRRMNESVLVDQLLKVKSHMTLLEDGFSKDTRRGRVN